MGLVAMFSHGMHNGFSVENMKCLTSWTVCRHCSSNATWLSQIC